MVKKSRKRRRTGGAFSKIDACLYKLLEQMGGSRDSIGLAALWKNWDAVLGPDFAGMTTPLGHKGRILLLGAEDSLIISELHFQSGEILEKVNAWLRKDYFQELRVNLHSQKNDRPKGKAARPATGGFLADGENMPERARLNGYYLKDMDKKSAVARCYARFVKAGKNAAP